MVVAACGSGAGLTQGLSVYNPMVQFETHDAVEGVQIRRRLGFVLWWIQGVETPRKSAGTTQGVSSSSRQLSVIGTAVCLENSMVVAVLVVVDTAVAVAVVTVGFVSVVVEEGPTTSDPASLV